MMPTYLSLCKFTEQGIRNVKESVHRAQAANKLIEAAGGRVIGIWWAIGPYDLIQITEAPNNETAVRLLLANGMQGNIRTETLEIFSEEEMQRIVQGLP